MNIEDENLIEKIATEILKWDFYGRGCSVGGQLISNELKVRLDFDPFTNPVHLQLVEDEMKKKKFNMTIQYRHEDDCYRVRFHPHGDWDEWEEARDKSKARAMMESALMAVKEE